MSWHQFRYIFDKQVENALRYSMQEAFRRQITLPGFGTSDQMIEDAIETFKRKMEKHTGRPLTADQGEKG